MKKRENLVRSLKLAAAAGLMGCAFLFGGMKADAATMKDVFDEHYYADRYPDLRTEFGYDREALWQHFVHFGLGEGRMMNEFIDVVVYRDTYPDLNDAFGDDWDAYINHYLTIGFREGRSAGSRFDALDYEERYEELQKALGKSGIAGLGQLGGFWEQAIARDSYGAQWGLNQVDKPKLRSSEEIMHRLNELGEKNELIAQICSDSSRYPESMLAALANNPELADFVNGYTGIKTQASGGFSESELALKYPLFLQWDPRWGYVSYGYNGCIGIAGCGPASLSMALYYLTGDASITPDSVAAYSMAHGYYVSSAGTAWKLFTDLPTKYGVKVSEPGSSEQAIKAALDQGKIVICSMKPGDFTAGGHFIVIYGYDEEGFRINDPNCVARSMKHWTYGEISAQIKHVWTFERESASDVSVQ